VNTTKSIAANQTAPNFSTGANPELIGSKARTETNSPRSIARLSLAVLSGALLMVAGTETASAGNSNTWTWSAGLTSTNGALQANYTETKGSGAWNLTGTTNDYTYTNNYSQTGVQYFDFGGNAVYADGLIVVGYTNDVIFTILLS